MEDEAIGIMGLEDEFALTLVSRNRRGRFVHPEQGASYLLRPVGVYFKDPEMFKKMPSSLKRIGLFNSHDLHFWSGVSGGKILEDNGLLEYATPECDSVESVVLAAKGGEKIVNIIRECVCEGGFVRDAPRYGSMLISKYNSDLIRRGSAGTRSRGSHENYSVPSWFSKYCDDEDLMEESLFTRALASLLGCRQILCGAGGLLFILLRNRNSKYD